MTTIDRVTRVPGSARRVPGSGGVRRCPHFGATFRVLIVLVASALVAPPAWAQVGGELNQGPKEEAVGDRFMVSTQLPAVTDGALEVLRNGGNAVDAAITAVFLQHVHDIHQVSHFGSMSAIYFDAESGRYHVINAVSDRPRADGCERRGDPEQVAIGGVVRGLEALWERFGTREWAEYLEPAIRAAEEGVPVSSFMYTRNYERLRGEDRLIENPEAAAFYMPEGFLVPVGERWQMPVLAAHLRKLAAEGADYMYTGEWGRRFVEAANEKGYCVDEQDLADYEAIWQEPVRFTYREHSMIGSPPPDEGGLVVGYNLQILENFDLAQLGHYTESAETLEIMARAFGRVSYETSGAIRDPRAFSVPVDLWLSDDYGRLGAQAVRQTMTLPDVDLASLAPGGHPSTLPDPGDVRALGSNHNVLVDDRGNWISMLHTGHGGAPGVFIDGVRATGSGAFGLTAGPGRRLVLPITAIMIEGEDGAPWLAMGTPGYPPQPVTEVLVNILDFGMPPKEAVDVPRFWAFRDRATSFTQYGLPQIEIESRISEEVRRGIESAGLRIRDLGPYYWSTGSMQVVWRDRQTGRLHGVTDPRRLGKASGL